MLDGDLRWALRGCMLVVPVRWWTRVWFPISAVSIPAWLWSSESVDVVGGWFCWWIWAMCVGSGVGGAFIFISKNYIEANKKEGCLMPKTKAYTPARTQHTPLARIRRFGLAGILEICQDQFSGMLRAKWIVVISIQVSTFQRPERIVRSI